MHIAVVGCVRILSIYIRNLEFFVCVCVFVPTKIYTRVSFYVCSFVCIEMLYQLFNFIFHKLKRIRITCIFCSVISFFGPHVTDNIMWGLGALPDGKFAKHKHPYNCTTHDGMRHTIAGFPAAAYAAYAAGRGFSGYPSFGLPYHPTGVSMLNIADIALQK